MTAVPRDGYGRPLVIPPGGGKPVPYQRCTTFIDVLEDKSGLVAWGERQVALGMSRRPDLVLQAASANGNKSVLTDVTKSAHEAAGSSAKATIGTALHALTEQLDRGDMPDRESLPEWAWKDLCAYYAVMTNGFQVEDIEVFVVEDQLKVGGTFDRTIRIDGELFMADIKTGGLDFGERKYPLQMAVYARSQRYNPETGERSPLNVSLKRAYIIHLPAGEGRCSLIPCDIEAAAKGIWLAADVREWRRNKGFYLSDARVSA